MGTLAPQTNIARLEVELQSLNLLSQKSGERTVEVDHRGIGDRQCGLPLMDRR